jgi:hypothetical protein
MSRHEPPSSYSISKALRLTVVAAGVPVNQRLTELTANGKPGHRRLCEAPR